MTPATVREAMIAYGQAVLAAFKADPRDNGPEDMDRIFGAVEPARDKAIRAVLAAADAGETEGPWRVERNLMTGRWWIVKPGKRAGMEEVLGSFADEPEARAVCNALNRVSALAGGGET